MPLYGGIDLHANNSVVILLNEQDQSIYHKRLPNDLATIVEQLAPYHWAFVVQLQEGMASTPQSVQGRVEHVTSGRVTDFCSLDALLAFMAQVLTPPVGQPP
jgi:hypothetical protein